MQRCTPLLGMCIEHTATPKTEEFKVYCLKRAVFSNDDKFMNPGKLDLKTISVFLQPNVFCFFAMNLRHSLTLPIVFALCKFSLQCNCKVSLQMFRVDFEKE